MGILSRNDGVSRRGFLGTFTGAAALVLSGLDRRAMAFEGHPEDVIHSHLINDYVGRLCYNENPLGPCPSAIQAIADNAPMAHRYPDWYAESLVSELASRYDVSTDQVICGCGGTEMLRLSAMAFTQRGKNVIVPNPTYSQFPSDAQLFGSSVQYVALNNSYIVNLQAILNQVNSNTTAICITNPNNPTGTIVDSTALANFVNSLRSDIVTVIDEAYLEYIQGDYPSAIELVRSNKNVVVIKTFSKVYGLAGARIGYALGKSTAISLMRNYQIFATVSRPSLEAAKAALDDTSFIRKTAWLATANKEYCFERFNSWGLNYIPSQASFFMVDVGQNADVVRSLLEARGIYVRTGWGMLDHLRVSTGTQQEMATFIENLGDILNEPAPEIGPGSIEATQLFQATPNPFNSSTMINIYLPASMNARLDIYDVQGRLVKSMMNGILATGQHSVIWNGTNQNGNEVATGAYFYRLVAGKDVITRRMLFIK